MGPRLITRRRCARQRERSTTQRSRQPGCQPTVDAQDLARHEGTPRLEVENRVDDVPHFAHSSQGMPLRETVEVIDVRIGVLMVPGATALTRTLLATSVASAPS